MVFPRKSVQAGGVMGVEPMYKLIDHSLETVPEQHARTRADQHFAMYLEQFPISRAAVERLDQNIAQLALAVPPVLPVRARPATPNDASAPWLKQVDLMENIWLCHRPLDFMIEYAVVEYFPAHDTYEIWNRGWNAMEVLRVFAQEQRQALEIWSVDMTAQLHGFLAENYSGQDMGRVADQFMHRFMHAQSIALAPPP